MSMPICFNYPRGANFDVNERDSLTYVAAERVYMRGEVAEARQQLYPLFTDFPRRCFQSECQLLYRFDRL